MRRTLLRWVSAAPWAVALCLAACGSGGSSTTAASAASATSVSSPSTSSTTPPTATTTVTTTAVATSSSTATSSAAQATTAAAGPGCGNAQVAVSIGGHRAGAGHGGFLILLRNVSASTCTLTGYPGAALIGSAQHELQVARTPSGYLGGRSAQDKTNPVVRLRAGATASALLEGEDSSSSGGACPHYDVLLVTPPNTTATHQLTGTFAVCNPQIHPVVAGTSGSQSG